MHLANLIVSAQPAINPGSIVNAASFAISGRQRVGTGAIQNFVDGLLPENTLFSPARPGQLVVIWGTGLGAISGDDASHRVT